MRSGPLSLCLRSGDREGPFVYRFLGKAHYSRRTSGTSPHGGLMGSDATPNLSIASSVHVACPIVWAFASPSP